MRNKLYRLLSVMCLVFLVSCVEAKEKTDIALLKETCTDLTKNDPDGKVYEPIVGRYLGSKSFSAGAPSGVVSTWYSLKMVIAMNNVEAKVSVGADIREFNDLMMKITKIIGEKYMNWPNSEDTDFNIGICAYKNYQGHYFGLSETLRKIG